MNGALHTHAHASIGFELDAMNKYAIINDNICCISECTVVRILHTPPDIEIE